MIKNYLVIAPFMEIPMFIQAYRKESERAIKNYFFHFLTKTYVVGTQKNGLNETVLLSTKNIC